MALLMGGGRPDIEEMPEMVIDCALGWHTTGDHFGFVRELEWQGADSLWGRWERGNTAVQSLVPMLLCPHRRDAGKYLCARIADHQGGHDWQLTEDWILSQDIATDEFLTARQS
ncbi:hypothetical protein [Streptomyces sp. CA-111067]|uniref:hypothetical protein n=1 Tax=Streptomyces sp. CA-111067 TaxID=3240046 RepID=UPI003D9561B9